MSSSSTVPAWFSKALSTRYAIRTVDVDGCPIEYYQWGDNSKPCLMLVHGNGGHANWWDFIAPHFIDDYCVCALHLGGMGNSGYRETYSFESFAHEVISVAEDAGFSKHITIVGHSLGGIVTIRTAQLYAEQVDGIVVVDSPMIQWEKEAELEAQKAAEAKSDAKQTKPKKYYPSLQATLERFRLIPDQPCDNAFIIDHVARHSIAQFDEGWSWKFDPGIHNRIHSDKFPIEPTELACRFTYIYGEQSILVPEHVRPKLQKMLKPLGPIVGIPNGHHHLMLDQPEALIATLRSILKAWQYQQGRTANRPE